MWHICNFHQLRYSASPIWTVMLIAFICTFSDQLHPPPPIPPLEYSCTSLKIYKWRQSVLAPGRVSPPFLKTQRGHWEDMGLWEVARVTQHCSLRWVGQWRPLFPSSSNPLRFQVFSKTPYSSTGGPTPNPLPTLLGRKAKQAPEVIKKQCIFENC